MAKPTAQELYGWFNKPPYESTREPYKDVVINFRDFNDAGKKGKGAKMRVQFENPLFKPPGTLKTRDATMDGYFEDSFKRIFEKEGPGRKSLTIDKSGGGGGNKKMRVQLELPPYIPPSPGKPVNGKGHYYGTFQGPISHWDPRPRDPGPLLFEQRNLTSNPGKKGTGYGYVDVGFSKYPEHKSEPPRKGADDVKERKGGGGRIKISESPFYETVHVQELFDNGDCYRPPKKPVKPSKVKRVAAGMVPFKQDKEFIMSNPGKKMGGCKAGGFEKYPSYYPKDPWKRLGPAYLKDERNKDKQLYVPINTTSPYSQRWTSHIQQIVKKEINTDNYKTRGNTMKVYTFDTDWTVANWNFNKGLLVD